jgi:hypothetical protein
MPKFLGRKNGKPIWKWRLMLSELKIDGGNPTFSLGPSVLETQDIMLNTHQILRVDTKLSPKAKFKPIFLVLSNPMGVVQW